MDEQLREPILILVGMIAVICVLISITMLIRLVIAALTGRATGLVATGSPLLAAVLGIGCSAPTALMATAFLNSAYAEHLPFHLTNADALINWITLSYWGILGVLLVLVYIRRGISFLFQTFFARPAATSFTRQTATAAGLHTEPHKSGLDQAETDASSTSTTPEPSAMAHSHTRTTRPDAEQATATDKTKMTESTIRSDQAQTAPPPLSGASMLEEGEYLEKSEFVELTFNRNDELVDCNIIDGRYSGENVDDLSIFELLSLWFEVFEQDIDSARLLETYLDYSLPEWRGFFVKMALAAREAGNMRNTNTGAENIGANGFDDYPEDRLPHGIMTETEALEVLGLRADASVTDINSAYRTLIRQVHPDQGGSGYLAAKVNQARDVLLGASKHVH